MVRCPILCFFTSLLLFSPPDTPDRANPTAPRPPGGCGKDNRKRKGSKERGPLRLKHPPKRKEKGNQEEPLGGGKAKDWTPPFADIRQHGRDRG